MVEVTNTIRTNGFLVPKGTSETIIDHLYLVARHGAVIYRAKVNEDVSEEFRQVADFIGLTTFTNDTGMCFVNENGKGANKHWMS